MAKVTAPFLSLSARGTIAGALTASVWKGINTMRIKSTPSNPKTLTQMAGRAFFAAVGKVSKRTDLLGDVVSYVKTKTPAQQSWASYFNAEVLGSGNSNATAAKTAYNTAGNSAKKAMFDDAAGQAGIESVDLDGTANTQVPAGLALWMAYEASFRLSDPSAPVTATAATEAQIFAYTEALTGVLPS